MSKSQLINYTDLALERLITQHLLFANPQLRLGDKLSGGCSVRDGKQVKQKELKSQDDQLILHDLPANINFLPKAPVKKVQEIFTRHKLRLSLTEIEAFPAGLSFDLKLYVSSYGKEFYLHPLGAMLENRAWLEQHEVGDSVQVSYVEPTFMCEESAKLVADKLTQPIMDHISKVVYQYMLSDY